MVITYYQIAGPGLDMGQWETFIVTALANGAAIVHVTSAVIPNFQNVHLTVNAAETYLDGLFPNPPWRKATQP